MYPHQVVRQSRKTTNQTTETNRHQNHQTMAILTHKWHDISQNSVYPPQNPLIPLHYSKSSNHEGCVKLLANAIPNSWATMCSPLSQHWCLPHCFQWAIWSHITSTWKTWEINMSCLNWMKRDWLRKLPGREPKSSFGKKTQKTLRREFAAGAFTYTLLRSCQVTMAHRNKEATRHYCLCFLISHYFPWRW